MKTYDKLIKIITYGIVGVLTTAVNFCIFYFLEFITGSNIANIISVFSAVVFAYAANKIFVFKSKTSNINELYKEILLFFGSRSVTMFIEIAGVFIAGSLLNFNAGYSKIAINIIVLLLNYIFSEYLVFNKDSKLNLEYLKIFCLNNKSYVYIYLLWVLFFVLCFIPIFECWYYGDDIYSRNIRELMKYYNLSFIKYNARYFKHIITEVGRFLPIHLIHRNLVFYIFNTVYAYRFYIFTSNFLAINIFAYMTFVFTKSRNIFFSVLILYPSIFFFLTKYDDPITSYFMFIQALVIYFCLAIIFTKYYMETNKKLYVILALILYIFSLLSYEISYPMGILFLFVFYFYKDGSIKERMIYALKKIIPFAFAAVINFFIYVYYSRGATIYYGGSEISSDITLIFKTILKQIYAAVPVFPSIASVYDSEFNINNFLNAITIMDIITVIVLVILCIIVLRDTGKEYISKNNFLFLNLMAVVLIVFPSIIIGVTTKYQNELKVGIGYLPTYLERFGFLIIGYFVYSAIVKLIKNNIIEIIFKYTVLSIISFTMLFSFQVNRKILEEKNFYIPSRVFIENTIKHGLLEGIPNNGNLLVYRMWNDQDSDSNLSGLFSDFSKKRMKIFTYKNNSEKDAFDIFRKGEQLFYFDHQIFRGVDEGYSLVGEVVDVENDRVILKNTKIYCNSNTYTHVSVETIDEYDTIKVLELNLIKRGNFTEADVSNKCFIDTLKFK